MLKNDVLKNIIELLTTQGRVYTFFTSSVWDFLFFYSFKFIPESYFTHKKYDYEYLY